VAKEFHSDHSPTSMEPVVAMETLRALRRILQAAERSNRDLAATTGLTPSQILVMHEVERHGEVTPTQIARSLRFGQATVTNIADRLVAAGYLTRTRANDDRRRILLRTTAAGREALEAAPDLLQHRFKIGFERLAPWEQAMMLAALQRLADLLGVPDTDAAPLLDSGAIDPRPD
jgi:DNA-binding MarR family transcriptional regulator